MPLSNIRILLAAAALTAALTVAYGQIGRAAEDPATSAVEENENGAENLPKRPLPATEFYTLAPFVVPMFKDGEHRQQLVIVVAVGIHDEDDRDEIRRLSAKLRNEIYHLMFKIVSFRTIKPRIPSKNVLQSKLVVVARRIAGDEMVKSIVIHDSHVKDLY
jgi:hypothetical protein